MSSDLFKIVPIDHTFTNHTHTHTHTHIYDLALNSPLYHNKNNIAKYIYNIRQCKPNFQCF